ncbi:MAG: DNA methylase, partial [Desulfovibrio sp.]|nr:DNA methylase [Desulfovibrio sp.]
MNPQEQQLPCAVPPTKAVTCLGLTFADDAARRAYFTEELRKKLQDPEFRKIEGFPIGTDEDILNLSDPPYYTACPNPWIADFIAQWEAQKPQQDEGSAYHREPFAADVSEGKNDPIYNAHSYHTKVPHKAIMRYILHYTEPGDIVFDGFCGTGMTGVAAQLCGDREAVMALGYQVQADGTILLEEVDAEGKNVWRPFSKLGARHAVLNDLSPAATFIAYNYNTPVDVTAFEREARRILAEVEQECGWMYATRHQDGSTGKINYTVWSDVFTCPDCAGEVVFWNAAVDKAKGAVLDEFPCPHCNALLNKRRMERAWTTRFDSALKETVKQAKQVPVLINYSVGKKRFEKEPDAEDLALIERIEGMKIPYWFPKTPIPKGDKTGEPLRIGITHVHHFYTKRNLWLLASYLSGNKELLLCLLSLDSTPVATKMSRFRVAAWINKTTGPMKGWTSGTLYVPSLQGEQSLINVYKEKLSMIVRALISFKQKYSSTISNSSFTNISVPDNSFDYIFLDPPFGANLNYSELNFLWESWLKVWTNNKPEAIVNDVQGKNLNDYRALMLACFREAFRVLKPGRWMTVEFSNTKASVWNSIQSALTEAGFIVANVAALDKQQGSFNAVTNTTSVKQDLVISAYKPNGGFEERFALEAESEEGVWDFVRMHLSYLPVVKMQHG